MLWFKQKITSDQLNLPAAESIVNAVHQDARCDSLH
jgi:hypothetical protein